MPRLAGVKNDQPPDHHEENQNPSEDANRDEQPLLRAERTHRHPDLLEPVDRLSLREHDELAANDLTTFLHPGIQLNESLETRIRRTFDAMKCSAVNMVFVHRTLLYDSEPGLPSYFGNA